MRPALVFPLHDTDGLMFSHLEAVTPALKEIFDRTFVSITPPTRRAQETRVNGLQADPFFCLVFNAPATLIGDHFLAVYDSAASSCPPAQVLHLCFLDRVAFALGTEHRHRFIADVRAVGGAQLPVLFQRSPAAWHTHPRNYREVEQLATRVGELLFGQRLDFAWCHLALRAQKLIDILPCVHSRDLGLLAEIVLLLKDSLKTQDVDWLAWEDPFIHSRDPHRLKREREENLQETHKRLAHLMSVLRLLAASQQT